MLQRRSLYFRRADRFSDRWEGVIPSSLLDWVNDHVTLPDCAQGATFAEHFRNVEIGRQYLNCWHLSDNESAAMWSIYGTNEEAVAIQSTVGRFYQALSQARVQEIDKRVDIMIGNVEYTDHESWQPPADSSADVYAIPFFLKRPSFKYENEFRAKVDGADVFANDDDKPDGINVNVDLQTLIEEVYVAPSVDQWFKDLVRSLLEQYGFSNLDPKHSRLDDDRIM